jgi:hypothetical protein
LSKPAIIGICAACVIAAGLAARALARHEDRPEAALVDTPPMPPETTPATVETFDPGARHFAEPTARGSEHRPVPALPATPAVPAPAKPEDREALDDTAILARLHDLAASNPEQSLRWAREALERFPSSAKAPEFEWNVVKALFNMGRLEDARDEARVMVRKYPDSDFTGDVERHLLNPQPNQ